MRRPEARISNASRMTGAMTGSISNDRSARRFSPGGTLANGGTPRATARAFASAVRSAVVSRRYWAICPMRPAVSRFVAEPLISPRSSAITCPPAASTRSTTLGLHLYGPDQPVEVGGNEDVGLAALDHRDRLAEPRPLRKGATARDVEFVDHPDERELLVPAPAFDPLALLAGGDGVVALRAADAGDPDRSLGGGIHRVLLLCDYPGC